MLAGGTDLLVQMKERGALPRYVLSLRAVADLSHVSFKAGRGLVIGSRASLTDVITNPIVVERYPILVECGSGWLTPDPEPWHRRGKPLQCRRPRIPLLP